MLPLDLYFKLNAIDTASKIWVFSSGKSMKRQYTVSK
jgi:hypothetical protein